MTTRHIWAAESVLAAGLAPAAAQLTREDGPDAEHQAFAADPPFDSVVAIRFTDSTGSITGATGVHIGDGCLGMAGFSPRHMC